MQDYFSWLEYYLAKVETPVRVWYLAPFSPTRTRLYIESRGCSSRGYYLYAVGEKDITYGYGP